MPMRCRHVNNLLTYNIIDETWLFVNIVEYSTVQDAFDRGRWQLMWQVCGRAWTFDVLVGGRAVRSDVLSPPFCDVD